VNVPCIHFRCADTPFNREWLYHFQYYSFFKEALHKIEEKLGKKYDSVNLYSCNTHLADEKMQESCTKYTESLVTYIEGLGYKCNVMCNSNIDDFAMMFYAPAVISTISSFSFMSGFFGDGMFIASNIIRSTCSQCDEWNIKDMNLLHEKVPDYHDTEYVIRKLKEELI
jgi:hypothetical protein